jgi:hypothetical protein
MTAQDITEPLLAIADAAGGEWPERARRAAVALLTGEEREDGESLGVRLLRDMQTVFDERRADRLSTGELLDSLAAMDEAPLGLATGRGARRPRIGAPFAAVRREAGAASSRRNEGARIQACVLRGRLGAGPCPHPLKKRYIRYKQYIPLYQRDSVYRMCTGW